MPPGEINMSDELSPCDTNLELIASIFARPRIYCDGVTTFQDVIMFVQGVCCGLKPPHASGTIPGLTEYLSSEFNVSPDQPWTRILLSQFGHLPLFDACDSVGKILGNWRQNTA